MFSKAAIVCEILALVVMLGALAALVYYQWRHDESYRRWLKEEALRRVPADETHWVVPQGGKISYGPADEGIQLSGMQTPERFDALRQEAGRGSEPDWTRHDPPLI